MKSFILETRLYTYQNKIGRYDLIEKYTFSKIKFKSIEKLKISFSNKKIISSWFNSILMKEFLTQQRFNFQFNYKINLNNFIITLRKSKIFIYLELFLHTIFLKNNQISIINISNTEINFSIKPLFNNILFNYLPKTTNFNKITYTLIFENKSLFINFFLAYYFIL